MKNMRVNAKRMERVEKQSLFISRMPYIYSVNGGSFQR